MRSAIRIRPSQHPDVIADKHAVWISVVVVFLMWVVIIGVKQLSLDMGFFGVWVLWCVIFWGK